jgi:hypothetical protein
MQLCGVRTLHTIPPIADGIGLDTPGYAMNSKPSLLMIPCFAGAPWKLE